MGDNWSGNGYKVSKFGTENSKSEFDRFSTMKIEDIDVLASRFADIQLPGFNSGYISTLPTRVKRRLKALKKIQHESSKIEAKFYEEVHKLECKYQAMYQPLREKRSKLIKGEHEPNDDECQWPSDDEGKNIFYLLQTARD